MQTANDSRLIGNRLLFLALPCLLGIFLLPAVALATPLLKEPSFLRLHTATGLSQDTVNTLLFDDEGFLWLGTESGLNRYDGYQNVQISGSKNEFNDVPVQYLFQDSRKNLWVSEYIGGIHKYNLKTNTSELVISRPYQLDPDFIQSAGFISEDSEGNIWFSMDESLVYYSYKTGDVSNVFSLPTDDLDRVAIRTHLISADIIMIGTTEGLHAINRKTQQTFIIEHAPGVETTSDKNNVKSLLVDKSDNLWVGTVEGLYQLPMAQVRSFILEDGPRSQVITHMANRNIWKITTNQDDILHIATDMGYYRHNLTTNENNQIFLPTDSRHLMASDVLKDIIVDRNNNLWLGSESDGAMYWYANTTLFTNVFNARGGRQDKILSHNDVWSLHQQNEDTLWIGTRNGLNKYNLQTGQSQQFMVSDDTKAQFSASSILYIHPGDDEQLWLQTGEGLIRFNTQTQKTSPLNLKNAKDEAIFNENIWNSYITADGNLLLITDSGFYRYSPKSGEVIQLEQLSANLNPATSVGFKPGINPNTTLVTAYGELWEMDNLTGKTTLIHKIALEHKKALIYPSDILLDDNNTIWVSYPSHGLYGVSAETYEQQFFFDKTNKLPTNVIFDLKKDNNGNVWMGSNTGLIKLTPNNQNFHTIAQDYGLANVDFNLDASLTLTDGRMVYGSPKGITLFNPNELAAKLANNIDELKTVITNATLTTTALNLPFTNLDGQSIDLAPDDLGLSIRFSTLQFEDQENVKYNYELQGAENINYPITKQAEVMFPKLEPGQYTFMVSAVDSDTGISTKPAKLYINVNYPPFASPKAYVFYAFVALVIVFFVWSYRTKQNQRLAIAHQQTLENRNRLRLALSASNSGVWEYNVEKDQFWATKVGSGPATPKATTFAQHLSRIRHSDKERYKTAWQDFLSTRDLELDITYRMRSPDGEWFWYKDVGKKVKFDKNDKPLIVTGTFSNVTKAVVDKGNLRLFGEAFKHTLDWVIIYNAKYLPIALNDAFKQNLGLQGDVDVATELNKLLVSQPDGNAQFWHKIQRLKAGENWKGEDRVTLPNGNICDIFVHVNAVPNVHQKEQIEHLLVIISDITEQKAAEAKLTQLANFDSLTGLPNRTLLLDRIERGIEHARRNSNSMAVFFIDLDKFKQVNDSLGHKAGDELLKIIAKRLTNKLRGEDTVARLGGDEFVIMIEEVESAEAISMLVSDISQSIDLPIMLGSQTVSVSSSIGIALFPGDGKTAEELLRNADIAMYHAKEQGRSNFQFFTQQMDDLVKGRLELENRLKEAHKLQVFENYYQPIVNSQTRKIEGFEILMRWPTEDGMIPPDKFIPISEELGLIESMTLNAFERAMPILSEMREGKFEGYFSFNLSAKHFDNQMSVNLIISLLETYSVPVDAIRFEITESALMRDYDKALTYMTHIRDKGFLIALDDFGTGYSSLKYLKEFPINIIKVDKSFVDDIGKNQNNEAIILTTLSMAEQLNMSCIAEGIESLEHVEFFSKNKCHHLQGYYFSKPVPGEQAIQLLHKEWSC